MYNCICLHTQLNASHLTCATSRHAATKGKISDDTSVFVIDIVDSEEAGFPDVVASLAPFSAASVSSRGGLFSCFGPAETNEPNSQDSSGLGHLALFSDIDSLQVGVLYAIQVRRYLWLWDRCCV